MINVDFKTCQNFIHLYFPPAAQSRNFILDIHLRRAKLFLMLSVLGCLLSYLLSYPSLLSTFSYALNFSILSFFTSNSLLVCMISHELDIFTYTYENPVHLLKYAPILSKAVPRGKCFPPLPPNSPPLHFNKQFFAFFMTPHRAKFMRSFLRNSK